MRGEYSLADIATVTGNNNKSNDGLFNGDGAWWIIILLLFGWGRNGFGGNGFGGGNMTCGANASCATPADVYNAVDQQTLISKLDNQTYGLADSTFALNNTIVNGFNGVQNALCQGFNGLNVAYLQGTNGISRQIADCCCQVERGIDGINYNNAINTNSISRQISDCCCDLEKMNMQNRYDAQTYNCNTLQAIDKLGDRIINRLTQDKIDTLQSENTALRFAASQERQNNYLTRAMDANVAEIIRRTGNECPSPAYIVPNPNCCYNYSINGVGYGNGGCANCSNF